jgi:hypothetical protein
MYEKRKRQPVNRKQTIVIVSIGIVLLLAIIGYKYLNRPQFDFDGEQWSMQVDVEQYLDSDGIMFDADVTHDVVLTMTSEGDSLFGSYVGSVEPACSNAALVGEVDGNQMAWTVTYSGTCCNGAQMEFTGTIADDGQSVTGEMAPLAPPSPNCWLWWGNVTLRQR